MHTLFPAQHALARASPRVRETWKKGWSDYGRNRTATLAWWVPQERLFRGVSTPPPSIFLEVIHADTDRSRPMAAPGTSGQFAFPDKPVAFPQKPRGGVINPSLELGDALFT